MAYLMEYIMRYLQIPLALVAVLFFAGCAIAPQKPVAITDTYWEQQDQRIGVYVQPIEAPQLYLEGDVRLLDYAVISAVMSSVKSHFSGLDTTDYEFLREDINNHFSQEGKLVKLISEDITLEDLPSFNDPNAKDELHFSRTDYSQLKNKLEVDQLLIIKAKRVGLARPYASIMPMADPRAIFEIEGELVDLSNNQLLWYSTISHANFSTGDWDEPPTYPGLTNAFYTTLEAAKQEVMTHFQRKAQTQAKISSE
jgi:hypothetical protein